MAQEDKIGALWLQKDKNGKTYMSGSVGETKVVIFKNNYKKEDKHPDYIVYEKQGRKEEPERHPGDDTQGGDIPF
jgi:uncharacterized protein (DUF736 family)